HVDGVVGGEDVEIELILRLGSRQPREAREVERAQPELAMLVADADPAIVRRLWAWLTLRAARQVAARVVGAGHRREHEQERHGARHCPPPARSAATPGKHVSLPK